MVNQSCIGDPISSLPLYNRVNQVLVLTFTQITIKVLKTVFVFSKTFIQSFGWSILLASLVPVLQMNWNWWWLTISTNKHFYRICEINFVLYVSWKLIFCKFHFSEINECWCFYVSNIVFSYDHLLTVKQLIVLEKYPGSDEIGKRRFQWMEIKLTILRKSVKINEINFD